MPELLKLADGTLIDTATGKRVKPATDVDMVMSSLQAKNDEPFEPAKRYLDELPASPKMLNAVNVILVYKLFGLNDADIAYVTDITIEQVAQIAASTAYAKMFETVLSNIRNFDSNLVRKELNDNALIAARSLTSIARSDEENAKDRINAANSILDRTGNRPVDVIEHRHSVEGGLSIRIIEESAESKLPTINLEAAE